MKKVLLRDMSKKRKIRSILLCGIIATASVGLAVPSFAKAEENGIILDGNNNEWVSIGSHGAFGNSVQDWKMAKWNNCLFISYQGATTTQWDYSFLNNDNCFKFIYSDGSDNNNGKFNIAYLGSDQKVKDAWYGDWPGSACVVKNGANANTAGPYVCEFMIPFSAFPEMPEAVEVDGVRYAFSDIEEFVEVEEAPLTEYKGIQIDGAYEDWKAVEKQPAGCPNEEHRDCITNAAAVFDGEFMYLYIKEADGCRAENAGSHGNGKFALVSDLGFETDFQLITGGAVAGLENVQVSHVGSEWEIAIPKSELCQYERSFSFGYYLGDTFVGDIVNLQPDEGNVKPFEGVGMDGMYEDWQDYPHKTIEYATAGSQDDRVDAKGALYFYDGQLYGHVVTSMPAHMQEAGGEFLYAMTINFNDSNPQQNAYTANAFTFSPLPVTVDGSGNINWNPQTMGLAPGKYEFYLASASELPYGSGNNNSAWRTSTNINNLSSQDTIYGKMIMSIGEGGKDEMEFEIYTDKLAAAFGVDETDLKVANAQFGRIGQQWISAAGTSTGPILGLVISLGVVAGSYCFRKKK